MLILESQVAPGQGRLNATGLRRLVDMLIGVTYKNCHFGHWVLKVNRSVELAAEILSQTATYLDDIYARQLSAGPYEYDYLEAGTGETIILLHGFAGSKITWRSTIAKFKANYRVIALDIPGIHVIKQLPAKRSNFHLIADWFFHFLEALGLDRVHLIGHSASAAFGAYVAAKKPLHVQSLTMISLPQWYPSPLMPEPEHFKLKRKLDNAKAPIEAFVEELFHVAPIVSALTQRMYERVFKKHSAQIDAIWDDLQDSYTQLPARMLKIKAPVHFVYGADDKLLSNDLIEDTGRYINSMKITRIANSMHVPYFEKSAVTYRSMARFIDSHQVARNR